MSRACYCDRCGEIFNTKVTNNPHVLIEFARYSEKIFKGDLCEECGEALEKFMEKKLK